MEKPNPTLEKLFDTTLDIIYPKYVDQCKSEKIEEAPRPVFDELFYRMMKKVLEKRGLIKGSNANLTQDLFSDLCVDTVKEILVATRMKAKIESIPELKNLLDKAVDKLIDVHKSLNSVKPTEN